MTNDIERHAPGTWQDVADGILAAQGADAGAASADIGATGPGPANPAGAAARVNANGAPLLGDSRDLFRPKASSIPAQPGVYKWRDGEGRVIYVGKAKNLRNRLSNYFQPLYRLHPRTQTMVLTARNLEWTVVGTELESLTLEYTWIKEFDPRFNVQFRDDKTYPYLAISVGEEYPRVWVTRSRKHRGTRYLGPYAKVWELRKSLDALLRAFPVRTCTDGQFRKARANGRPCLLASIGKCSAPCVGRIDPAEHRGMCARIAGVMTGRLGRPYLAQLTRDMKEASAELEFEKAARLRDEIAMLRTVMEQNAVTFDQNVDADVFGLASDDLEASVHMFAVRAGAIRGERNWGVERVEDVSDAELVADLIVRVYAEAVGEGAADAHAALASPSPDGAADSGALAIARTRDAIGSTQSLTATDAAARSQATRERHERQETTGRADLLAPVAPVPREVIVPVEPARRGELESWLSGLRGAAVTIRTASRGEKKALMDRAGENARQALQRAKASRGTDLATRTQALQEIQDALFLDQAPLRIECYDISNTIGGAYQVASMVVFEDGVPKKGEYRRFAIRGEDGAGALDDTAAIHETLTRRFRHGNIAGDSGDSIEAARKAAASVVPGGAIPSRRPRDAQPSPVVPSEHQPFPVSSSDRQSSPVVLSERQRAEGPHGAAAPGGADAIVQQNTDRRHFAYKPNLVVVDGGLPQVQAAARALAECGVDDVALCGLAKKLEEVWVPDDDYPLILPRRSEGLYLLQRVRDESHRFAITYHRQKRRKGALASQLDAIPGIGPTQRKRLLDHFGSFKRLKAAGVGELMEVPGIGERKAKAIHDALHPVTDANAGADNADTAPANATA